MIRSTRWTTKPINPVANMKDTSYLRKMEICYAEVNKLLEDLDDTIGTYKHKEESLIFNKTFLSHCNKVLLRWISTHSLLKCFKCLTVYYRFLLKWFVIYITALDCFLLEENNTKTLFSQELFSDPRRLFRQAWKRTTLWSWASGKKLRRELTKLGNSPNSDQHVN